MIKVWPEQEECFQWVEASARVVVFSVGTALAAKGNKRDHTANCKKLGPRWILR
jgi:hypothetical protein